MFTFFLGVTATYVLLDIMAVIVLITAAAYDGFPLAIGIFGIAIPAALYFLAQINVYAWFIANPLLTVAIVLSYLVVGVVWSILAWFLFTREHADELQSEWEKYKHRPSGFKETDEEKKAAFLDNSSLNPLYRKGYSLSIPNNFKIVNWIVMWPFSIIWKAIRSFTIDFSKLVLRLFGRIYDGMTNSVTSKLK